MQRPRWRIIGSAWELVLVPWGGDVEVRGERLTPDEARRALDALLGATPSWGLAARTLAEAARYATERHGLAAPFHAADARAVVREALARGVLTAWRAELRYVAAPVPPELDTEAIERIPLASALIPKTWIEIELTDMEGNPRAGERYWIKLPDGSVREGALDRYGRAYFGDLDPGTADIRWPDLDEEATVPVRLAASQPDASPAARALARTWVEFELLDMEGAPVEGERCQVTLPDGRRREARTDRAGRVRFDDIDPGQCKVRWPDRDELALSEGPADA